MREALLSPDRPTRDSAQEQILQKSIPEIIYHVIPILKDLGEAPERETRLRVSLIIYQLVAVWGNETITTKASLDALGEQKAPLYRALLPVIKISLQDADPQVRMMGLGSIESMYPTPPAEARKLIPAFVNDPDWKVRVAALEALGRIKPGTPEVRKILLQVLKGEEHQSVRGQAFRAIGELGFQDTEVLAILTQALAGAEKGYAIQALGQIGKPARRFIPELEKIRDDPEEDEVVREEATYALRRLQKK